MARTIQNCVLLCAAMLTFNCRGGERSDTETKENDGENRDQGVSYPTPSSAASPQGADRTGVNPSPGDPAGAGDPAVAPSAASERAMEDLDDDEIAKVTEQVNTAEIQQAELARTKSKNTKVREFAAMMIQHHGEAKRKQAALKLSTSKSEFSRKLDDEGKATLERLQKATGIDFDREYLEAQVDGHTKVLNALEREMIPRAEDEELKAYLAELKPTVEQHLEQAKRNLEGLATSGPMPKKEGAGTGNGSQPMP